MRKTRIFDRVVWAVDPFAEDLDLQRHTGEALGALVAGRDTAVEPVSIVHWEDRAVVPGEPSTIKQIESAAVDSVEKLSGQLKDLRILPPKVFVQNDLSLGSAVSRLIRHAKDSGADLIAVGTEAKKGATRFLLGSFAETLILHSDVPVLVVSPRTKIAKKIERIVYPTDLSAKSKEAFGLVVELAREAGAEVTLFHRVEFPATGNSLIPLPEAYREACASEVSRREKELDALGVLARERGVSTNLVIHHDGAGTVEHIERFSQAPSTIIAMVSRSGAWESALLGSVTRKVIRRSACPVWVIHPSPKLATTK